MMINPTDYPFEYGDMWSAYDKADLFLITTNATMRNGRLAMGAGVAREAKVKFSLWELDRVLGQDIGQMEVLKEVNGYTIHRPYYLLVSPKWPAAKLGLFQTKDYFRDKADLMLISTAVEELRTWIEEKEQELGRKLNVHLNCPGTGYGGQSLERVLPYLKRLPDSVTVWRRGWERPLPVNMPPDGHPLWAVVNDGLIESVAVHAGVNKETARTAFHALFVGPPSSEPRESMMQYLTTVAYLQLMDLDDLGELSEDQYIGNAFQQARNTWSKIVEGDK